MMGGQPELLSPAGSLEALKTAVLYGANAVYIGGMEYGLRAKAKNFYKGADAGGNRLCAYARDKGSR